MLGRGQREGYGIVPKLSWTEVGGYGMQRGTDTRIISNCRLRGQGYLEGDCWIPAQREAIYPQ